MPPVSDDSAGSPPAADHGEADAAAVAEAGPTGDAPPTKPAEPAEPVIESPTATQPAGDEEAPAVAPSDPPVAPAPPAPMPRVVRSRRGPLAPEPPPAADGVTDEQIERAIRKGVDYLAGLYSPAKHEIPGQRGPTILATYALVQCGLTVDDPRLDRRGELVDRVVARITTYRIGETNDLRGTYERGLRAAVLALLDRPEDRGTLREDVGCLATGHVRGAYSYTTARPAGSSQFRFEPPAHWDNSNSQFGLLGVWSGAEVGVPVPRDYWKTVGRHWTTHQEEDGGWGYDRHAGTRLSMTAAGTASLLVVNDYLNDRSVACGRDPYRGALGDALARFEGRDDWLPGGGRGRPGEAETGGYELYAIERVGLASGFKYFGEHDWFRELATFAVGSQRADGSWGAPGPIETSFHLLFLARGRPPVMMNKLRFDGYWANRPRDAANLARYAARAIERPLNFQVTDVRKPWQAWTDAPVLYVASHEPPEFGPAEYDRLRAFALNGGLVFTHADCDSREFNRFAERLVKELFPQYEFADLPASHPVYELVEKVRRPPRLRAVGNGSRLLLVHSPTDLGRDWQLRNDKAAPDSFRLGLNLFVYATGKRDLRNRLDSPYVPPAGGPASSSIGVARVRYPGQWDAEPAAWPRFANLFRRRTGVALDVRPVEWEALAASAAPLAHLSGTARYDPTAAEVAALRAYVEAGGTLVADTCGGRGAFASEMKQVLARAFPHAVLDPIHPTHAMLAPGQPGMADLSAPRYRPYTVPSQGNRPGLFGFAAGRGQVVLTTLDVTSGLLHTGTWGINGFDPAYCERLMQNLVLWAFDSAPDPPPPPPPGSP